MTAAVPGMPVEAIEAAVSAVVDHHVFCDGGNPCDCYFNDRRKTAQVMLAAALPSLREVIAAEVLAPVRMVMERGSLYDEAQRVHEFTHPTELAHRVAALTMGMLDDLRAALSAPVQAVTACATCGMHPEAPEDQEPIAEGDGWYDPSDPRRCPSCGSCPPRGASAPVQAAEVLRAQIAAEVLGPVRALAAEWETLADRPMPQRADTETGEDQGVRIGVWHTTATAARELRARLSAPVQAAGPVERLARARRWIETCVDPVAVGPERKAAMLAHIDGADTVPDDLADIPVQAAETVDSDVGAARTGEWLATTIWSMRCGVCGAASEMHRHEGDAPLTLRHLCGMLPAFEVVQAAEEVGGDGD